MRTLLLLILVIGGCRLPRDVIVQVDTGSPSEASGKVDASGATVIQDFDEPWPSGISPDGLWRINGPWPGTQNNIMDPANTSLSGGQLSVTVRAGKKSAGELQSTAASFSYGTYEASLKLTDVPGVCVSFMWKQEDLTGDVGVHFLTNEDWMSTSTGKAHLVVDPDTDLLGTHIVQPLTFHPSRDFHRYGWVWTSGRLDFTIDGSVVYTFTNPPATNLANPNGGTIMFNTWTGDPNWGGGPPAADATSTVDWIRYTPGSG